MQVLRERPLNFSKVTCDKCKHRCFVHELDYKTVNGINKKGVERTDCKWYCPACGVIIYVIEGCG